MNKKRFRIAKGVPADIFPSVLDGDRKLYLDEVVELLNYLDEKNEWLKKQRDYWSAKYEEGTGTFISHFTEENQKSFRELLELKDSECLRLTKENKKLRKQVENLQEVAAKLCATLMLDGVEIEINGENLKELIYDE